MSLTGSTKSTSSMYFMVFFMLFAFCIQLPSLVLAQEEQQEEQKEEEDKWADVEFPYEDGKLLLFFDVNQEISRLQRETREEIDSLTQEYGFTPQRFQQITNAAQIGQVQGGAFSNEEIEAFNELMPMVQQVQRNMQGTMQLILQDYSYEEEDFSIDMNKYREMLNVFRQDEELREYIVHLARERVRQEILEERRRQAEKEMEERRQQEQGGGN